MSIKSRSALKKLFENGEVPTGSSFADLIDSVLNMRDDHFFGEWLPSRAYHNGDVVLYEKSIYQLVLEGIGNVEEECEDPQEGDNGAEPTMQRYCNSTTPDCDDNWCELELNVEDDDWYVYEPGEEEGEKVMLAKVYGRVSIGRDPDKPHPKLDGQFEVLSKESATHIRGQYLMTPDNEPDPTFQINRRKGEEIESYLKTSLNAESSNWITNAPLGFLFKKVLPVDLTGSATAKQQQANLENEEMTTPKLLMILTHKKELPHLGINTDEPEAMLDVHLEDKAQFMALPPQKEQPSMILYNLHPSSGKSYLAASVEQDHSAILTNAREGFRFGKGSSLENYKVGKAEAKYWMVIDAEGNVGIGTEDPKTRVEVTDQESGKFKMSLNNTNPAFSIVNIRPDAANNYFSIGTDNRRAILLTDTRDGFYFMKGDSCGNDDTIDENINHSAQLLMSVRPDKKVGIGMTANDYYELDVNGTLRTLGMYIETNKEKIKNEKELGDVLGKIMQLTPITFEWNEVTTERGVQGKQFGFYAYELADHFKELVRNNKDNEYGIAYQNMVVPLVKAIQEQQGMIEDLTKRVEELERICGENED